MKSNLRKVCLKNKGWSIYYLGHILSLYGHCSMSSVYHWADGRSMPNAKNLDMLCQLLGCTFDDLYTAEPYTFESAELQEIAEKGKL